MEGKEMADLLSGLGSLGLGNIQGMDLFETQKKPQEHEGAATASVIEEKDIVYDRGFECPVCDEKITSKTVKSGKSKLLHNDLDLRPVYDNIDVVKYDVIVCPHCGFSALTRYFKGLTSMQMKLIKENISQNFKMEAQAGDIITYEQAFQRYQLALANAIVKKAKASEKAFICLKSGWLLRGWRDSLGDADDSQNEKKAELEAQENEYLKNAFEGFVSARQAEGFPMCGMDEVTVDYLLAVLARRFEKYDVASKLIGSILVSPTAAPRMKDKARDLKEMILEELKSRK